MDKLEIAKWATDYALKQGADQTAVNVQNSRSVQVEVRDKKIETLKETTENNLNISIYLDPLFSGRFFLMLFRLLLCQHLCMREAGCKNG